MRKTVLRRGKNFRATMVAVQMDGDEERRRIELE